MHLIELFFSVYRVFAKKDEHLLRREDQKTRKKHLKPIRRHVGMATNRDRFLYVLRVSASYTQEKGATRARVWGQAQEKQ